MRSKTLWRRETSTDLAAFLRTLRLCFPEAQCVQDRLVRVPWRGGQVEIGLRELPPHRLGPLALPVLEVTLRAHGLADHECDAFLARYELCFRRGGG